MYIPKPERNNAGIGSFLTRLFLVVQNSESRFNTPPLHHRPRSASSHTHWLPKPLISRLASRAFETIHAATQASSPTIAQAARDQEAYIEHTGTNAVSESVQRVTAFRAPSQQSSSDSQTSSSSPNSNNSDSERNPTLGPEMHKAGVLAVHPGAQWN